MAPYPLKQPFLEAMERWQANNGRVQTGRHEGKQSSPQSWRSIEASSQAVHWSLMALIKNGTFDIVEPGDVVKPTS